MINLINKENNVLCALAFGLESYMIDECIAEEANTLLEIKRSTAYRNMEECFRNAKKLENIARSKNTPDGWKAALNEYKRVNSFISQVKNEMDDLSASGGKVAKVITTVNPASTPFSGLNARLSHIRKNVDRKIEYIQKMLNK